MKKSFFFTLLLLSFYSLNAQNFQWAKSYSGQDGFNDGNSKSNKIYNSAFDSQGNIYILGRFGVGASIDDEYLLTEARLPSNVLAKLDSNGNLLWKKVISNSAYDIQVPNWMEIVGDTSVAIMIEVYMPPMPNEYGYYLDTLVYGIYTVIPDSLWQIPYCPGRWTAYIQFDLDGNVEREYFLKWNCLDSNNQSVGKHVLFSTTPSPFHVDKNGYIYMITDIYYQDLSSWRPHFRLNVNGEDREGSEFIIDTSDYNYYLSYKLLKFTPNFDLLWHKDIFMDTIGGCSEYEFWTQLTGISTDEEDNIYLTGTIHNIFEPTSICQTTSPYIMEFMLDSTHSVKINDRGCLSQGFIVKYDTAGVVQWENQTYTYTPPEQTTFGCSSLAFSSAVNENQESVFMLGYSCNFQNAYVFFNDTILFNPEEHENTCTGFFAQFNSENGEYISHGITESDGEVYIDGKDRPSITTKNNQIFAQFLWDGNLILPDTSFTSSEGMSVVHWINNGTLISAINLQVTSSNGLATGNTLLNNNGDLFITGRFNNSITLGETTLFGSGSNSAAFFAKYHDPTFSVPYRIEDVNLKEGNTISIYPNPTKDKTTIFSNEENIKHITVYNMRGLIIFQRNNLNTNQTNIDLSINSNGIYVIKVVTDNTVYSNKIILTK
ncbi:MAG: T9SS type A sorting domain-containing protein [Bacilli bacterium]|nr:T9SS type A sorting domain-containing protein [Bacilli bacterium]